MQILLPAGCSSNIHTRINIYIYLCSILVYAQVSRGTLRDERGMHALYVAVPRNTVMSGRKVGGEFLRDACSRVEICGATVLPLTSREPGGLQLQKITHKGP